MCEPGENLLLDEKKIRTRSLVEAKLEQFSYGFICLKFNSDLSFLLNPYNYTFLIGNFRF